jgi:pimeloyl-ACP methyl ester carboxylesterase
MNARFSAADARARMLAGLPVSERCLEPADTTTVVIEGGAGPPLVLLHGPGQNALEWFRILPDLVASYHVIAPDLPGHGATIVRDGVLHADGVCAWLRGLIEQTCTTAPTIVAQIVGGAIAARFAARYPEQCARLVLVNTLGLVPLKPDPAFERALVAYMTHADETTYDDMWEQCVADVPRLRAAIGERWDWLKRYSLECARIPAHQAQQHAMMEEFGFPPIPAEELARITVPVSLIWGRNARATRIQAAETASARYGWPLHVIDGAGDDPAMDQPNAFIAALHAAHNAAVIAAV